MSTLSIPRDTDPSVPHSVSSQTNDPSEHSNEPRIDDIGVENYARLTIPPGIWFGFQGNAIGRSLIMNVADIVHDPEEVLNKPVSSFLYDWN